MGQILNEQFDIKLIKDSEYGRLHITHPKFSGRIRKRIGSKNVNDIDQLVFSLKHELNKKFSYGEILKTEVESFIINYVDVNIKGTASIFDYKDDFIEYKKVAKNKNTRKKLSKSTISSYQNAIRYFEKYLIKNRISPHPSMINESVMDGFYDFIDGKHNYRVKLHTKLKGFIKYLNEIKQLPMDISYKQSTFTEEYDNQSPEENDIALTEDEVKMLIELRRKLQLGIIEITPTIKPSKIPMKVQLHQFNVKKENLITCLDCFLFMISTGQYYADIKKSTLNFSQNINDLHISYRRAKNNSLCRAIPMQDDDTFIGKEIIKQYKIKNGRNFPIDLSLTHFDKHLERISALAEFDFKLTNKMARKTFASTLYFKRELPIRYLQILLGHKNINDTMHYLRIKNDDLANEIKGFLQQKTI